MWLALILSQAVLGQAVGNTVRHRIGPLSFELPAAWRQSSRTGTVQFDAASGEAYMLIDINNVEKPDLTPETCLEIVLKRLNAGPNWRKQHIEDFATAHQVNYDRSPNLANTARVEQIVGCDGRIAWSMVFFIDVTVWPYYAQVTAHVLDTLQHSHVKPGSREATSLEDSVRDPSP